MDTPFFHIFLSLRGYLLSKSSYLKKKLLFLWIVICDPTYLHCRGGLMSTCFFFTTVFDWLSTVTMSLLSFHVFKLLLKSNQPLQLRKFSHAWHLLVLVWFVVLFEPFSMRSICFYRTTIIWNQTCDTEIWGKVKEVPEHKAFIQTYKKEYSLRFSGIVFSLSQETLACLHQIQQQN